MKIEQYHKYININMNILVGELNEEELKEKYRVIIRKELNKRGGSNMELSLYELTCEYEDYVFEFNIFDEIVEELELDGYDVEYKFINIGYKDDITDSIWVITKR